MFTEFDKSLIEELKGTPISRKNVKALIKYGADINSADNYEYLMENVLGYYPCEKAEFLPEVVKVAIDNGWDTKKQGLKVIQSLVFSTATKECFFAEKQILENGVTGTEDEFNETLETIGTEESYQRCCEHNTERENLYYVMYEAVDATKKGESIKGIDHHSSALGMTVDKIIYYDKENNLTKMSRGTEYGNDIGLVSGDRLFFITTHVNVFFKDEYLKHNDYIQNDDLFGINIVGSKLIDIEFSANVLTKKKTKFNQPVVILWFDNGYGIKFTHNFGETNEETKARFIIITKDKG